MDETTFIDLQEDPHLLPPVPAGALNTDFLTRVVLGSLEAAGATAEMVLGSFYSEPVLWAIPPRVAYIGQQDISMRLGLKSAVAVATLRDVHLRFRKSVTHGGFNLVVRSELAQGLGARAMHPLMFSETEAGVAAADMFSMEYILAIATGGSKFTVTGTRVAREYRGKRTALADVRLDKFLSPTLSPEYVHKVLHSSRGTAVYPTTDIFDRCLLWAKANMFKEDTVHLKLALSWLKSCQSKTLAYDFEQALHRLEPFEPWVDAVAAPQVYTYDALNYARDLWILSDKEDHEAFRDFYSYVVPTYLDDGQFRQLFRTGMVLKEDFNDDILRRVDTGMPKFEGWFAKMLRQYAK